jgi:hypothetical protein
MILGRPTATATLVVLNCRSRRLAERHYIHFQAKEINKQEDPLTEREFSG